MSSSSIEDIGIQTSYGIGWPMSCYKRQIFELMAYGRLIFRFIIHSF